MNSAVLDRIRSHLSEVKVPSNFDKVYKDECMYCFASPESTDGIFVNMKNWHGVGARFLELDHQRTGASLYYNEEHQRVPLPEESVEAQDAAPTKMAIGGNQGFQVNKKRYEITKICRLVIMPDKAAVVLPCPELPELLLQAITAIQGNEGSNQQDQASTWEEEKRESKYARQLEQLPPERKISPNPSDWECEFTGVKENLWLNLSTGTIGSGRRHWDGSGGNGAPPHQHFCGALKRAALKHFEQTGTKYPLVVKLGTITAHSADVYSYAPDEDDLVTDPLLKEHLAHWGINMMQMEKTDKTMAELQIDMNIKFEYNAITEGGSELKPVMGPGKVGINNLGNYCYMSSILQALWAIPAFGHTFAAPDKSVLASAPADIANDFPAQFAKVGSAIVSGETDRLPYIPKDAIEQSKLEASIEANAVPPRRFKTLVGKGHPEFSTGHQQDACEFFIHLMQLLERAEHKSGDRMRASEAAPPLSSIFKFKLEQRTQCAVTGAVSYKDEEQNVLHLDIPLEAATNSQEVAEYAAREQKRKEMKEQQAQAYIGAAGGESVVAEEAEEPVVPIVPFDACLEKFAAEATLPDYYSPALGAKGRATVTHRLASFPPYLMVHLQKYFVDESWRPRKMEVLTDMQHTITLERLRARGPQPDERLQPKEPEVPAEAAAAPKGPAPDAAIVSSLAAAGFGENACKRAAVAVGNSDPEAAMNWLLSHMEDADINDPLPSGDAAGGAPAAGAVDPESVGMLSSMGFTERQAKAALKSCNGSVERAADWLFTRTDDLEAAVAAVESEAAAPAASTPAVQKEMLDGPGKYELVAIVSHIGSNIACGHYVAHVKKDGLWYIFNDEKVALSERLPIGHGYMYLYRRTDQPWS